MGSGSDRSSSRRGVSIYTDSGIPAAISHTYAGFDMFTSKRDKSMGIKGAAIGIALGALLPDQYNPVVIVRRILAGVR